MQEKNRKSERNDKIIADYMSDIPIKSLVDKYKLTKQSIYSIIKTSGHLPKKPQRNKNELLHRNKEIVSEYKAGTPMPDLAETYDLTRQGIQLILKAHGISAKDGGARIRAQQKMVEKLKKNTNSKDERCLAKWGCTYEQWQTLRDFNKNFHLTPIARYIQHRSNVKRDNLIWQISLWDWWNIWQTSGKYNIRGRGKEGYCMTRKNTKLGYTKDNVKITTVSENLKGNLKNNK